MSPEEVCAQLGLGDEHHELVAALLGLGVSTEAMRRAAARGRLQDAIFDVVLDRDRAARTVTARQIEERGGWPVAMTQAMVSAWGFPSPGPDEPAFGPAEADALIAAAAHREWWPADVQLEVSRVWGQALSRIAATEVYNFRFGLEPQVRRGERTPGEALAAIQQALAELLPLADPLLLGVHRRWIDYELTQYAVREAERHAPDATIPGAVEVCLLFCDLKDFTAYADVHGDRAATEAAARFARVTSDERGEHGQVVKGLGDGAMLVYPEAGEAVDAWRRFHDAMDEPGLPALHGAVHQGEVLRFEGDYFGGAVNLTARLLSLAGTGELLATGAAVARAGGHRWLPLGTRALRGLREEVAVFLLDDGA